MAKSSEKKLLFIEHLEPHKDSLYRVCKSLIWHINDIEDALQTTIMNAYKSFDKFEEGSNFKAWIFKYLVNTTLNFNKKYTRVNVFETVIEDTIDKTTISPSEHESLDILEILEREDIYHEILNNPFTLLEDVDKRMKDSLNRLNMPERTVFLLKSLAGFSYKEIANVLEIPIGTVMSHLYRARVKLRESLCDYAKEKGLFRNREV